MSLRTPAMAASATLGDVAEWFRRGSAKPVTAVRFRPSPPTPRAIRTTRLHSHTRALSSGGERFLDAEEVRGSNPLGPTATSRRWRLRTARLTVESRGKARASNLMGL